MIRIGLVGIGNIGTLHAGYLLNKEVLNAELTCVCDIDEAQLKKFSKIAPQVCCFNHHKDMFLSNLVDAIIVCTPHFQHPQIAIDAFKNGLHVIVEKPIGVYALDVLELNRVAKKSKKKFSTMFCMRTDPAFKKIKYLVDKGELGDIKRVNWIATDWYRPQAYHDSSSWRSTWKGEGGGVLVNQSPHNLDILQWIFGMPKSVFASAECGKYFDIEVEDEVNVFMKYKTFSCVYIASTGECPGSNRLEISGTMGRLIYENKKIEFIRNEESEREFNAKNTKLFGRPAYWHCQVPEFSGEMKHKHITQNFINAILNNEELIAPGEDGINEVLLSNAIHMSAWTNETVHFPIDNNHFYELLKLKILESENN